MRSGRRNSLFWLGIVARVSSRRDFLRMFGMSAASARLYAQKTVGLPPVKIREVKVIATSPPSGRGNGKQQWVFVKVETTVIS